MTHPTAGSQSHRHAADGTLFEVLIIGGGFGGVGMAIRLQQAGIGPIVLLERSGSLGGCWRDNTYPGAACDVPSHLYSFSFEPRAEWSRRFAPQAEILDYIRACADRHALHANVRLNAEVDSATYDEAEGLWSVTTRRGDHYRARHVVAACGQLSRPAMPSIEGAEQFQGARFHSAQWDHGVDLTGRRVAVIGTGASAIQFIPQIAPRVAQLAVFQRSAPYVLPKPDRVYTEREKRLFKGLPGLRLLTRTAIYSGHELRAIGFTRLPWLLSWFAFDFKRHLRREVPDDALRAKLTPDHPLGCKRILISNDFYPAMNRPNVSLVTDRIARITAHGIETADGREHAAEAIIYGTGFAASEFLAPMHVTGRGGQSLREVWRDGAQAYLGITVPRFPNFYMLYGPNTNLGHNSIIYMLESQFAHVMACLRRAQQASAKSIEVKDTVFRRYNEAVQRAFHHTVWDGGCSSWYVDAHGRNTSNWPGFTLSYRHLTRDARLDDYQLEGTGSA